MYIKRKLEQVILNNIDKKEYLAIVGPRQAGKTTLIKKIQANIENSVYLTFEDRELLELFDRNIKLFAKEFGRYKYIFVDEFQYSVAGGKNLKFLYDVYPDFKFIISGSSAIDLTIKALKYLTGRVFVYNLYQLDFFEFLAFKNSDLSKTLKQALAGIDFGRGKMAVPEISSYAAAELERQLADFAVWGGYPRTALAKTEGEKKEVLKNIYNTYFLRDVRDIAGLADDYKLSRLIKALAAQAGQLVEYGELGQVSGYDYISLKKYLNILEKTFVCAPLRPFFRNKRTELVKNPKIYFFDAGLRNFAVNNFNPPDKRSSRGALMENYAFTEFLKRGYKINYWRTKQKAEVDFIIEAEAGRILPVEVKNTAKKRAIPRSLYSFMSSYLPEEAAILNNNYIGKAKAGAANVYFLPFWAIN